MSAVLLTIKPGLTLKPGVTVKVPVAPPTFHTLTVNLAGNGNGLVTSTPAGIDGATLTAQFAEGTYVTLTANSAMGSVFTGWSGGGASGTGTAQVYMYSDTTVTATFNDTAPPPGYVHENTEEEIVNQETILQYYETLPPGDRKALIAAMQVDELNVLARERAERKARSIALGVHTGKTIDEYSTSAWQIKQDYPDSEDGVYWIQNDAINNGDPFQVYCDMTTLGGGWTLLVQTTPGEWTAEQVYSRNALACPQQLAAYETRSNEQCYSILSWADKIKRSESGFDFMITAREHGSLGGAWTANEAYSFVQTLENVDLGDWELGTPGWRKNITELARFGYQGRTWDYGSESMEARMPWVGIGINCGWLTTDGFRGGWWGTLVTNGGGWDPAPWLSNIQDGASPGVIWYWVR